MHQSTTTSFRGQDILVGLDVHVKSWDVSIATAAGLLKTFTKDDNRAFNLSVRAVKHGCIGPARQVHVEKYEQACLITIWFFTLRRGILAADQSTNHKAPMYQPNLLSILVAGILPMVIGAIWYGPLFGRKWLNLVGKTEQEIKESANPLKMYGVTFVMSLVLAFVLAHVLQAFSDAYGIDGIAAGLQGGFWMWLGFVQTIGWQSVAFEDKPLGLYGMNVGYNLVCLLAVGALLGVWR